MRYEIEMFILEEGLDIDRSKLHNLTFVLKSGDTVSFPILLSHERANIFVTDDEAADHSSIPDTERAAA